MAGFFGSTGIVKIFVYGVDKSGGKRG
jgi:hypothetical protein